MNFHCHLCALNFFDISINTSRKRLDSQPVIVSDASSLLISITTLSVIIMKDTGQTLLI